MSSGGVCGHIVGVSIGPPLISPRAGAELASLGDSGARSSLSIQTARALAIWSEKLAAMAASRSYDRAPADVRPVTIEPGFVRTADGSALISQGDTRVICTASVTGSLPRWLEGSGRGWVTAEYGMLPASTGERRQRDVSRGRQDGRGVEIQRLIGRSLRGVVDFQALGERSVYVDCDVLQADGGTRCAAITGGYVALHLALAGLVAGGELERLPLDQSVAAVSVGIVDGRALCDLDYPEDSGAEVDANVVMAGDGGLVEVQATAERTPLSRASLDELLGLAEAGIARLREEQARATGGLPGD
jgi:ribonuclease PH